MEKVFFELQALLKSEYEFVSELAMEYVMYSLIQARIEIADGLRIETLERISFQRDYIIEVLREEYADMMEILDNMEDILSAGGKNCKDATSIRRMKSFLERGMSFTFARRVPVYPL